MLPADSDPKWRNKSNPARDLRAPLLLEVQLAQTSLLDRSWSTSTWLSVVSLAFGSFALVSSELLPMGLFTPLARDFGAAARQ